jgi:hypothetical protein
LGHVIHFAMRSVLLGAVVAALAAAPIFLFTRKGSAARAWMLATPNRVTMVGIGVLAALWTCLAPYNRATGA